MAVKALHKAAKREKYASNSIQLDHSLHCQCVFLSGLCYLQHQIQLQTPLPYYNRQAIGIGATFKPAKRNLKPLQEVNTHMKKSLIALCCLIPAFFLTGCMEEGMLINVNPDGSGTITMRKYLNGDAMGGMMGGLGGEDAKPPSADEQSKQVETEIDALANGFGPVTKQSGKAGKNKQGWPGYEAVYAFNDLNKINLAPPEGGEGPSSSGTPEYAFKFTPGSPAKLEVIATVDADADKEAADKTEEDMKMEIQQQKGQMAMMSAMLAGMRQTVMVKVNGTVVDSNADIVSPKSNSLFILADIEPAKMIANPAFEKMMIESKGAMPHQTINTPGMRFQNPREPVVVTFQ